MWLLYEMLGPVSHLSTYQFAHIISWNFIPENDSTSYLFVVYDLVIHKCHQFVLGHLDQN